MLAKLKDIPVDSKEHIVDNVCDLYVIDVIYLIFRMIWTRRSLAEVRGVFFRLKCYVIKMGNGLY